MTVEKALVVPPALSSTGSHWLQTEVKFDRDQCAFRCTFSSLAGDGTVSRDHARCTIAYAASTAGTSGEQVPTGADKRASQTRANVDALRRRLRLGAPNCFLFNTKMVYRMVAVLARFDRGYQGLKEVVLDSNKMAAASKVDYSALPRVEDDKFAVHPAHLDSLMQSAGFVMNANEKSDLELECFVNHGWDALMLFQRPQVGKEYDSYVQMARVPGSNGVWKGDLSVVCEDTLVAVIEGITVSPLVHAKPVDVPGIMLEMLMETSPSPK